MTKGKKHVGTRKVLVVSHEKADLQSYILRKMHEDRINLKKMAQLGMGMNGTLKSYFDDIKTGFPDLWSKYLLLFKKDRYGYPIM